MKTINICIGFVALTLFFSCNSRERETKDAKKNIEVAIAENDFSKARESLGVLDGWGSTRDEYEDKINLSEITYFIKQGEYVRARAVASEHKAMESYSMVIANEIPDMIVKKDYASVFNILSNWTFKEDPVYSAEEVGDYELNEYNQKYNSEIGTFNDLVFRLFNAAIVDNNKEYIKKSFLLFQDELVLNTKKPVKTRYAGNYYNITFKKDNKSLREAKQKLAEYNIK